jgi:hypothetical protein
VRLDGERLVVERLRPRYTLDRLLSEHAAGAPAADDDWLSSPAVGRERI